MKSRFNSSLTSVAFVIIFVSTYFYLKTSSFCFLFPFPICFIFSTSKIVRGLLFLCIICMILYSEYTTLTKYMHLGIFNNLCENRLYFLNIRSITLKIMEYFEHLHENKHSSIPKKEKFQQQYYEKENKTEFEESFLGCMNA